MADKWFKINLRGLAAFLLPIALACAAQGENLFSAITTGSDATDLSYLQQPAIKSIQLITVNVALITGNSSALTLNLPSGETIIARQHSFTRNPDGSALWQGSVTSINNTAPAGGRENSLILVRDNDNITGTVRVNGQLYQLLPLGHGSHAIIELDAARFPVANNDIIEEPPDSTTAPASRSSSEPATRVRVALVTTNQTRASVTDIPGRVALALATANQGLRNSGVNMLLENAGILNASFNESGDITDMLLKIRSPGDRDIGAVANTFRETRHADVMVLLTASANGGCKDAYQSSNKANAFSVLSLDASCMDERLLAHVIGHNMGANHNNSNNIPFPWGKGYQQTTVAPHWSTIMADACSATCPGINYWSSPDITYNGLPAGNAMADNARVLNERRNVVADFLPDPSWQQVGSLYGEGNLAPRQLFQIAVKDSTTHQPLSAVEVIIDNVDQNAWPTQVARAVNDHFAANLLRAGELTSSGNIELVAGSRDRNDLWMPYRLVGSQYIEIVQLTYAEYNNVKWFSIGNISASEDATAGTLQQLVLTSNSSNQILTRIPILITDNNKSPNLWPSHMAQLTHLLSSRDVIRAGEVQSDGSIKPVAGNSRHPLWVPQSLRNNVNIRMETVGPTAAGK
ncbi:M12 family metallo-peptidase [Pantoea sp. B65]|uniref:M12 family metallo-peptidase n=1 Tax=Pantoea sp. B65 TaxID=2813359 RepID=UPI0039B69EAB